jgi:hypothetical protein
MDPLVDCPREGEFSTVFLQEQFEEFLSRLAVCATKQVSILSCSELQAGILLSQNVPAGTLRQFGNVAAMAAVARAKCIAENIPCRLAIAQGERLVH